MAFLDILSNLIVPIIIFVISIGAAYVVSIILKFVSKATKKTKSKLDDKLIDAVRSPIFFAIISIGAYIALKTYNPDLAFRGLTLTFMFTILWIVIVAYFVARLLKGFFDWYVEDIHKTKGKTDDTIFRFVRRILILVIYLIALMIILDKAGIQISPLLAGLGIAGLAVALALEDTLKNFFSAIYIAADKPVKIGDYIEIDENTKGYVHDVGWRSTTIKTMGNNYIVIPNNTLAQSVIKNYNDPQKQMSVLIDCGVAYNSDLEKVEKITIATAKKVLKKSERGVSDYEPLFRYKEFGDSSINFYVVLRTKRYEDQYALRHEFIKELFKAFNKNRIEIPFPQQDVYIKQMKKK
jgi:small-conductance mechanosensitive channel